MYHIPVGAEFLPEKLHGHVVPIMAIPFWQGQRVGQPPARQGQFVRDGSGVRGTNQHIVHGHGRFFIHRRMDGPGTQGGNPGTSDTEGSGYFDVSGYRASLDANKVMPAQAVRRGITGTVTIRVYFDGEGNYVRAEIERSSGSSLLDNDALALAARSGGATNTTGKPKSDVFYIRYEFE